MRAVASGLRGRRLTKQGGGPAFGALPQPGRRLRGEAIDRQLPILKTDLKGIPFLPALVKVVAAGQEVDALVGRADPPPGRVGLLTDVGAIDEYVGQTDQLGDVGVATFE